MTAFAEINYDRASPQNRI